MIVPGLKGKGLLGLHNKMSDIKEIIFQIVLEHFGISEESILSKRRFRRIVYPRQVCMYLLYKNTNLTLVDIGTIFSSKDHTTVIHAKKTISDQMQVDREVKDDIIILNNKISKYVD